VERSDRTLGKVTDIIVLYDGEYNQQEGIHIVVGIVALVNRATNFKVMTASSIAE